MKTKQAFLQVAVKSKVWQAIVKAECFIEDAIQASEPVDSIFWFPLKRTHLVHRSQLASSYLVRKSVRQPSGATFEGSKMRFEDIWALFSSLVDQINELVCIKMARLGQCLTGFALEDSRI